MTKIVIQEGDEGVQLILRETKRKHKKSATVTGPGRRFPVHVVYGGADLFKAGTPQKLGRIALGSLETYAPDLADFARAFELPGSGDLPADRRSVERLERRFAKDRAELRAADKGAWFAAEVRHRVRRKLLSDPVEDYRIDFEDGYGFRLDSDEDADAQRCAEELAAAFQDGSITAFSGFRTKAYGAETRDRASRTLRIFLEHFLRSTKGRLPGNFVVTLPKVIERKEVTAFCRDLKKIEKAAGVREGSVKIELMIEHPLALIDRKGNFALRQIVEAAAGRCVAAHFGAYDYTASIGIAASLQDIAHPACDFVRQMMLAALSPLGIRLSDSVTTEMPVPIHRGDKLSKAQQAANKAGIIAAWRKHFGNVRRSLGNGFYQSWDLHPNQLVARYAAVYSFFLETADGQAARLRAFMDKASTATLTGHTFDDAATATGILNFFRQGLDSGAFSVSEAEELTGLSANDLREGSFQTLVESRRKN